MRKGRKGFSLIELLIVVAIIAALVGVAVPFFQDNLQQAQQTKAKEDLDTIRNAISLHDAQNRPLVGTAFGPLLGRYLQEIPKDPWGNTYLLDAQVGIIMSYGADGQSDGTGADQDLVTRYKSPLRIQRTQYDAPSWGKPNGAKVILTMSKPFQLVNEGNFLDSVELLRAANNTTISSTLLSYPISFTDLLVPVAATWDPQTWTAAGETTPAQQNNGLAIVTKDATVITANTQMFTATMAMNFTWTVDYATDLPVGGTGLTIPTSFGICERYYANGPLDPTIYGPKTSQYFTRPQQIDLVDGWNRGVRLEKF